MELLLVVLPLGVIIGCAYGGWALIRRSLREPAPSSEPPAAWIAGFPHAKPALRDPRRPGRVVMFFAGIMVIAAPFIAGYAVFEYLRSTWGRWPPG